MRRCEYPGCRAKAEHFHHQQPRSDGGSDSPENLQALCAEHHRLVHSQNGDWARWGREGGKRTAQSGKSLKNLKQFKDHPEKLDDYRRQDGQN